MRQDPHVSLLPPAAEPKRVMASDGVPIATYDLGAADDPVVLAVHGFASSAYANWIATGWVRELNRAGYRVIALDQRGHGHSGKPHEPAAYSMALLVDDVQTVLDAYLVDEAEYVGYSLGARVGWHAALGGTHAITRAVLGGIPDGDPLTRFQVDQAKTFLATGHPVDDRLTQAYITMAESIPGNDLAALVALVEGMRGGEQPDPANPPQQPVLFAAGGEDPILPASKRLAASAPHGEFFLIPGRNHFNAPTARAFRTRALEFLESPLDRGPEEPAPATREIGVLAFDGAGSILAVPSGPGALGLPVAAPDDAETDIAAAARIGGQAFGMEVEVGEVAWVEYTTEGTVRRWYVARALHDPAGVARVPLDEPERLSAGPIALLRDHGAQLAAGPAAHH